MKKSTIALTLALVIGLGLAANNAFAWNNGGKGYGCNGGGRQGQMMNNNSVNSAEFQKFLKETEQLRADLRADRVELRAIMSGQNPDAKRARALSGDISEKQIQLAEIARKNNVSGNMNFGMGWHGGPGKGRGNGQGNRNCW